MTGELTHASFFSGVGGLDIGLERAGWRTVSFSEIDPYASAVLAERWPGVPNLGDIVRLGRRDPDDGGRLADNESRDEGWRGRTASRPHWTNATLWTGGFPCQDLSVAGKRAGFTDGTRSSLAFAFLGLVERYRPPALLFENVPGLLSSAGGGDMGRLLSEMVELGYGVAWRILDARHFGVPQRRRRVFIVGLRADALVRGGPDDPTGSVAAVRAASVLAVGTRCDRHPPTGVKKGEEPTIGVGGGAGIAGNLTQRYGRGINTTIDDGAIVYGGAEPAGNRDRPRDDDSTRPGGDGRSRLQFGPSPDAGGVRAADGLAGRVDGGDGVVQSLDTKRVGADDNEAQAGHLIATLRVGGRASGAGSSYDNTPWTDQSGTATADDQLLPAGLDSHRYRCAGNGVVAPVAEWIGTRLAALFRP